MIMSKDLVTICGSLASSAWMDDFFKVSDLIFSAVGLMVEDNIENVISGVVFSEGSEGSILVKLVIRERYFSLVVGKKFTNIVCLRKLVSNASGRLGYFFCIKVFKAD